MTIRARRLRPATHWEYYQTGRSRQAAAHGSDPSMPVRSPGAQSSGNDSRGHDPKQARRLPRNRLCEHDVPARAIALHDFREVRLTSGECCRGGGSAPPAAVADDASASVQCRSSQTVTCAGGEGKAHVAAGRVRFTPSYCQLVSAYVTRVGEGATVRRPRVPVTVTAAEAPETRAELQLCPGRKKSRSRRTGLAQAPEAPAHEVPQRQAEQFRRFHLRAESEVRTVVTGATNLLRVLGVGFRMGARNRNSPASESSSPVSRRAPGTALLCKKGDVLARWGTAECCRESLDRAPWEPTTGTRLLFWDSSKKRAGRKGRGTRIRWSRPIGSGRNAAAHFVVGIEILSFKHVQYTEIPRADAKPPYPDRESVWRCRLWDHLGRGGRVSVTRSVRSGGGAQKDLIHATVVDVRDQEVDLGPARSTRFRRPCRLLDRTVLEEPPTGNESIALACRTASVDNSGGRPGVQGGKPPPTPVFAGSDEHYLVFHSCCDRSSSGSPPIALGPVPSPVQRFFGSHLDVCSTFLRCQHSVRVQDILGSAWMLSRYVASPTYLMDHI
ncbi:hypothetical protein AURDEDRAFT_127250 [Auricularia subglabra TFB-10046 SS5]|nr:hypothetical protein AURDEDRAFT_127250 [Auricularia subglabra TFB-10046 SS5]